MGVVAEDEKGQDDFVFVPNGENRRETAIMLVGAADEYGVSQRSIRTTSTGFFITRELADILGDEGYEVEGTDAEGGVLDTAAYTVADIKTYVEENPDEAEAILEDEMNGKNRSSLTDWLNEFIQSSGDRAEENEAQEQE